MKKKFTLLELLIVIAVIAILTSLLLPSLNSARKKAAMIQCMTQNSNIGKAMIMYTGDCDGYFVFTSSTSAPTGDYNWAESIEKLYLGNRKRSITQVPAGWWCPAFPREILPQQRFDPNNCTWAANLYHTAKDGKIIANGTLSRKRINIVKNASQVIMNGDSDTAVHVASFWKAPTWGSPGIGGAHPGRRSPVIFVDGHGQNLLQALYSKQYNNTNSVFRWWTYNSTTPVKIDQGF